MATERVEIIEETPIIQVTNRDFSLFLWQNPEFMRVNSRDKNAYLPGFTEYGGIIVDPALAEHYVQAPPNVMFYYQVWDRLLGGYYFPRVISKKEFLEFLKIDAQWDPKYWKGATDEYRELVGWMREGNNYDNLAELSFNEFPLKVRQAFVGWKNFSKEGEAIDKVAPHYWEMELFLKKYDHYARPYWINLVLDKTPHYLEAKVYKKSDIVPSDQMTGFLKDGIYNYIKHTEGL